MTERQLHINDLNAIFDVHLTDKQYIQLRRIENQGHRSAENLCNIPNYQETHEENTERLKRQLTKLLGDQVPVFFNGDPRGYCLKIPDDYVRKHDLRIFTDWGGYGIIAPDFN